MALTNAVALPTNPAGRRGHGVPPEIDRDHHDRPKIVLLDRRTGRPHVDDNGKPLRQVAPFTRPSTMGEMCEDQRGLGKWKAAVALWGAFRSMNDTIRLAVMAIRGYDDKVDKSALYELVDKAQQIADIDHAARHGIALHALFEQADRGLELPPVGRDQVTVDAYVEAMEPFDVIDIERFVVIDDVTENGRTLEINAAGTLDRRITVRRPTAVVNKAGEIIGILLPGDIIVVDIKTNSAADYYGVKYRLQCWLYAHGKGYDHATGERTPLGTRTDFALIVHVPAGGDAASFYWIDMRDGIDLAATAMKVREHRNLGKRSIWSADLDVEVTPDMVTAELARRDQVQAAERTGLRSPTLDAIHAEVAACTTRAELGQVYGRWETTWDEATQGIVEARMRELGIPVKRKAAA